MKLKNYLLIATLFVADNYILLRQSALSFASLFFRDVNKLERIPLLNVFKKSVFLKTGFVLVLLLLNEASFAQTYKTFSIREKIDLRGKMIVAGNNILGNNKLVGCNDNNLANQSVPMEYINIDNGATSGIFSSSSADLVVPNQANGTPTTCYRVAYAALYWGAVLQSGSRADINKVKLKLPGATSYSDINGEVVYDAVVSPIIPDGNKPYACYADVTSLLAGLPNLNGTYTVANVIASQGSNGTTGLSAGWTLFVVYEDPSLHMKSFNVFDGFSHIYRDHFEKIPVTGFITPPKGPVDLQFAYAALDGDKPQGATKLEFGTKQVVTPLRPANNFFISTIENTNGVSTPRNPSGTNTLGYDTGVLEVKDANPEYIDHSQTSTDFTLQVAQGQADPIFAFFAAYAVDIIAPKIDLTKIVKDVSGTNVGGGNVALGQSLTYEISYQSVGNDNVQNFTIKDVLPINITFNPLTDIDYTNAGGATLKSYDPVTRTIIFNIPNTSVEVNDGIYTIRLNIKVVPDCNSLVTACSNVIKNQAFATYQGVINTNVFQEEGSFASTVCKLGSPDSTNFLVDITNCKFTQNVILCGASVVLKASDGYTNYSWSTSPTGSPVIGTGQTLTVTQTGVYYVHNTAPSTCKSIVEEITVRNFGITNTNPIIPFADTLPICTNNGKVLPNIFLCGANATRQINTGISDAASIVWQKLNETSCAAMTVDNCANENSACTWSQVGTGPNYTANTSGQFRIIINYVGGCFSIFYFNVYQNLLNPTATSRDIICNTPGEITVGGVPSGYEYSLSSAGPYQTSNVFPITTPNLYTVYIKQIGVTTNPCIFSVPDIRIRKRDFTVSKFVTQPLCNGDKGAIKLVANDVRPQYYFSIHQGGTLVNSVGPIMDSDYEFSGLNAGTYTVRVWTDDGCDFSEDIEIINPPLLTATSAVTKPLTCTNGEITVYPVGGTPPFTYYINGTDNFQSTPQITVTNPLPAGGIYTIIVEDSKGCRATTTITVAAIPPPVYTVSQTNILCYNDTTGEIKFNVTNANGYTLSYGISTDNGISYTYGINPTISNLAAGIYYVNLKYSLNDTDCFSTAEVITITQPTTALTASAGVSELAGCGPAGEGKIRITNPQGGTPFPAPNYYLYSFDNQATWIISNEAYMAPGTYTVYIKDANGCIFAMPNIIIDPKPVEPTIEVEEPVFNCDGTATSTITVTNNGGANYSYQYLLDSTLNTNIPSNVFTNVPSGPHTVSVSYKLLSVPTYSNLLKEDFGSGSDVQSPGINPAFCFERQNFLTCDKNGTLNNGEYTVTNTIKNGIYSGWHNPIDHTAASATGRYLAVDAGTAIPNNAVIYRKTIKDIIPNQPIQVRFFATNLLKVGNIQPNASLTVELQNSSGAPLSSQSTGGIPKTDGWVEYNRTIDPGTNTTLDFVLRLEIAQVNGIDFAVDDITVYQLPKTCITTKDFTVIIPTDEAFTASVTGFKNITCAGANNGEITIAAQNFDTTKGFQYSIDNGVTWSTQMTSPYTIKPLSAGIYNIQIRYDNTGACSFSFSQEIKAPLPLKVVATATPAKCSVGATVTASATDGTPGYSFQLIDTVSPYTVTAFPSSGILTNVAPGTYTVKGTDANGCTDNIDTNLVIATPAGVSAVVQNTGLCFDGSNATITVNVSGGTGSYSYQISTDGGITYGMSSTTFTGPSASFTYLATATGTYTFKITDSFGCFTTVSQVINAKLLVGAAVTTGLDCDAPPANQAIITGTISGGTAPFSVVKLTATDPGGVLVQPTVTGTTFTYTTAVDGTYTFEITDAIGCKTTIAATVSPFVPATASFTKVDPTCNGSVDGSIKLTALTGEAPFTYSITGVGGLSSINVFGGLAAGTYNYIVRDNKGCDATGTITLVDPDPIVASIAITDIVCNANTPGSLLATITSGGVAPFTYTLYSNTFTQLATSGKITATSYNFTGLTFGDYYIIIVDAKGCEYKSLKQRIETPPFLEFDSLIDSGNCIDGATVKLKVISGGVAPYKFSIFGQPATTSPAINAPPYEYTFFNLLQGTTYYFQAEDANLCTSVLEVIIPPISGIALNVDSITNVTCNGSSNGVLDFTVSGFDTSVTTLNYEILDALTNAPVFPAINDSVTGTAGGPISGTITSLPAGDYLLKVTESTGTLCYAIIPFSIAQPAQPLLSARASVVNANCDKPAQLTLTTTGGTGPYTYAAGAPGFTPTIFDSSNVLVLDYGIRTNWDIVVKDAKGCTVRLNEDINLDPSPVIALAIVDKCAAEGAFGITVSQTIAGVGAYAISINNSTFTSISGLPYTVTGLNSGLNTISIKDANGCIDTKTITIAEPLQLRFAISVIPTCTDADGEVTLTASGGTIPANYEYSKDGSTYGITNVFPGLAPSATPYTFYVKDMVTGCIKTVNVLIDLPNTIIDFSLSKTDVTCNGDSDGTITVNLAASTSTVNNNPIYKYSLDGGVTIQDANIFSGLPIGNYTVTVISGRGCEATAPITVGEPAVITVPAPTVLQYRCNAGSNGTNYATITVTGVTGGSGVYANYQFIKDGTEVYFGPSNVYTESDLLGGSYTINVYDNKRCVGMTTAVIDPFIALDKVSVNVDNAITCTNPEDITVSVSSIGGTLDNLKITVQDVYYDAVTGAAITGTIYNDFKDVIVPSASFTGLPVGNYIITVDNLDTGCSIKTVHYVNNPNTFDLTIDNVVDVTCFNDTNGSVNVTFIDRVPTPTDESGPFNYTVFDIANPLIPVTVVPLTNSTTKGPITISGLAGGTYMITATLTNSPYCSVSKNFTITRPIAALAISETHTAITCITGNNDGSISASAVGGWPGGYQFELTGPVNVAYSTQSNFTNLTAGLYTIKVRDSKGCEATTTVTLVVPTPITVTASADITMLSCFGDKTATITVDLPTGGQGSNYMYTLNTTSLVPATANGPQASPIFSGLGAGTYTITVTDGYSCSATSSPIVITEPTEVKPNLIVATTQTCLTQTTLTLSATGGTGLYTYSDTAAFTTILGSFVSSTTFPVPVGTYTYYVKDANGCVANVSNQIKIDPLPPLVIKLDLTNAVVNCKTDTSGVIVATAEGGLGNYSYTLLDGAGIAIVPAPVQSTPGNFTQLVAGNYMVRVDSGDCNTTTALITITEPATQLIASYTVSDVTCNGSKNGIITVMASGGTGIIKYAITPRFDQWFVGNIIGGHNFDQLAPGIYDVMVQDENGCFVFVTGVEIKEPAPIMPSTVAGSIVPEICFGDKDGAFSINITGGIAPYSVSLDNINGTYTNGAIGQTQFDFTGLTGGVHTVYIRDASLCNAQWEVILPESVKLDPQAIVDYACVNNAPGNTVTVTIDASITNPADVDYSLDGVLPYQSSNVFTNVTPGLHFIRARHTNGCEKDTPNFTISQFDPLQLTIADGGLNEIVATATGGAGGYQYTLNGESYGSESKFIIYKSGDYTVEVTDENGCVASASRYFEYIDVCIPNYFTPNGDGVMDGWAPGCTINYKDLTFDIFDRYGRKIATYRVGQYWDGKYNGNELPSGDYWYVLKLNDLKDAREFVGHFTLYR